MWKGLTKSSIWNWCFLRRTWSSSWLGSLGPKTTLHAWGTFHMGATVTESTISSREMKGKAEKFILDESAARALWCWPEAFIQAETIIRAQTGYLCVAASLFCLTSKRYILVLFFLRELSRGSKKTYLHRIAQFLWTGYAWIHFHFHSRKHPGGNREHAIEPFHPDSTFFWWVLEFRLLEDTRYDTRIGGHWLLVESIGFSGRTPVPSKGIA